MFKRYFIAGIFLSLLAVVLVVLMNSGPTQLEAKEGEKETKSRYLVISPHTMEECLASLDAIVAGGSDELAKYDWGCMVGDHTGYAIVEATDDTEALKIVPAMIQAKARAVKLTKFTAEQVAMFHEK